MSGPVLSFIGTVIVALITGAFLMWGRSVDRKASAEQARLNHEQAEKTRDLEKQKVSREDFDSITRELRASLDDTREQLEEARAELREARTDIRQLRTDLDEEQQMRRDADQRAEEAERRAAAAEENVERLERRVSQLEDVIREAGGTIPAPLPDPIPPGISL